MAIFRKEPVVAAATPVRSTGKHALTKRAEAAPYNTPRPIQASAEKIDLSLNKIGTARSSQPWQADAWTGYERVGEIHYGFNLVANIMSRLRIYAASAPDYSQAPIEAVEASRREEDAPLSRELARDAANIMAEITGPAFSALVRAFTINICVPGECYLIGLPGRDESSPVTWDIRSTDEVDFSGKQVRLKSSRQNSQGRLLPTNTYVARIWRQNPRFTSEPDSSMVSIADPIEELLMLQRLVRSSTRSRLNAGLLFVPDGISSAGRTNTPADAEGQEVSDPGGVFLEDLMDSMVTPVNDEGSASAVVPMLVTGPTELGGKIQHITFERQSDEWLVSRADKALDRILQGIDIPKDIVTGLSNVKYSNAIVIDENLYKTNIEPLALMLVDALTTVYLHPVLLAKGYTREDIARVLVWYDPSEIVTRPNSADDATEGYDRYLLSPAAWRREHGFSDTDAPSESELALMLLQSKGTLPEDVTASLLNVALPEILGEQREENIENSPVEFPERAKKFLEPVPAANEISDVAVGEG